MAKIIPKKTPVPIAARLAEPGPVASTIGSIPSTKAREVIKMGRKRNWAAWMADCIKSPPRSTCTLANSTIRMAFFAANPTSITSPIWKYTSFSNPQTHTPR